MGAVDDPPASPLVLVLGEAESFGEALVGRLADRSVPAHAAAPQTDAAAREIIESRPWTAVAVLTRDDALALRLTLLCAHVRPDLALWASVFDRTIVSQLRAAVPRARILSPSEIAADALAEACLAGGARPRSRLGRGLRIVDDALRLAVLTGIALLGLLLVQIALAVLFLHEGGVDAVYFSARALATVADSPRADAANAAFKVVSTLDTIAALALLALFTAALVRIANRPRYTTLLGRRRAPARGHVIVVGLGQVGFRLVQALRVRRIPAIAVEADPGAPSLRLATRAGVPVAIGRGDDRSTLQRLGIGRAAAVAAVTSDDLTNVATAMAVHDLSPRTALVIRLGDGDVAAETESLLHLGEVCDIHHAVADAIARELLDAGDALAPGGG